MFSLSCALPRSRSLLSKHHVTTGYLQLGPTDKEDHPNAAPCQRSASKTLLQFEQSRLLRQDAASASFTRHSMAKVIYARLFDWLVWRINESICNKGSQKDIRKIGLLDIYGFEVFDWRPICIQQELIFQDVPGVLFRFRDDLGRRCQEFVRTALHQLC